MAHFSLSKNLCLLSRPKQNPNPAAHLAGSLVAANR
ncbi:hypothetical protein SOVF_184300 [Spinacia oleracea]|nr:hypothetical protein SOVF_184300 [Spinacia oleracea]